MKMENVQIAAMRKRLKQVAQRETYFRNELEAIDSYEVPQLCWLDMQMYKAEVDYGTFDEDDTRRFLAAVLDANKDTMKIWWDAEWRHGKALYDFSSYQIGAVLSCYKYGSAQYNEVLFALQQYAAFCSMNGKGQKLFDAIAKLPSCRKNFRPSSVAACYTYASEEEVYTVMESVLQAELYSSTFVIPRIVFVGLTWSGLTVDEALMATTDDLNLKEKTITVNGKSYALSSPLVEYIQASIDFKHVYMVYAASFKKLLIPPELQDKVVKRIAINPSTSMNGLVFMSNINKTWTAALQKLPPCNPFAFKKIAPDKLQDTKLFIDLYQKEKQGASITIKCFPDKQVSAAYAMQHKYYAWKNIVLSEDENE